MNKLLIACVIGLSSPVLAAPQEHSSTAPAIVSLFPIVFAPNGLGFVPWTPAIQPSMNVCLELREQMNRHVKFAGAKKVVWICSTHIRGTE